MKIIFTIILLLSNLSANAANTISTKKLYNSLSSSQKEKIIKSYNYAKTRKCNNGMTVGETVPSILGQESSFGEEVIGDKYSNGRLKDLYSSSLGAYQFQLRTARYAIWKSPNLKHLKERYAYDPMKYKKKDLYKIFEENEKKLLEYKSILTNKTWLKRASNNEKKAISTLKWAKKRFKFHSKKYLELVKDMNKDTRLVNLLLINFDESMKIATEYFIICYNWSLNRNYKTKYLTYTKAIGKYNGGWNNKSYPKKVIKRRVLIRYMIKNNLMKRI